MADTTVGSGPSSDSLCNNVANISSTFCINCDHLKSELQKLQDELKSAQLIIDILQQEAKSSNTSECISASKHECRANCSYHKECDESSTSDWIQVRVSHATKKRGNKPSFTGHRVQTSNRYTVLSNLQEAQDNLPKTVSHSAKISCVKKESSSSKKHTILLIGDSHARGISERLASYLGPFYHCTGYVKPNADLNIITSTGTSEVKTLDKNDVVIVYGGALDIARDNTTRGLLSTQQFIKQCAHTNVLILNAPVRFDLSASSCVNKEVSHFNRKMLKLIKPFDYAQMVNVNLQREQFTTHGMHINRQGKDVTAQYLVSAIHNIFTNHHCNSPIILKWREDQQGGDVNLLGLVERNILNEDSELAAMDEQGKCFNNLKQNPVSGIAQNTSSDITQSAYSVTVQSSDCGSSDLDNLISDVTQSADGISVQSSNYRSPDLENFTSGQSSIDNCAMLPSVHPSTESTDFSKQKRSIRLPKTRSDDFLWI